MNQDGEGLCAPVLCSSPAGMPRAPTPEIESERAREREGQRAREREGEICVGRTEMEKAYVRLSSAILLQEPSRTTVLANILHVHMCVYIYMCVYFIYICMYICRQYLVSREMEKAYVRLSSAPLLQEPSCTTY